MTKFLGEEFTGTISGVQEYGIFVELENGVEGLVKLESLPYDEYTYNEDNLSLTGSSHKFSIGNEVKVIVAGANTHLRQVDFELAGVERSLGSFVVTKKKKETKNNKKFSMNSKNNRKKSNKRRK